MSVAIDSDLDRDLETFAGAYLTRGRMILWLLILTATLVVSLIVASVFGSVRIDLIRTFTDTASADHAIFFGARLPRVLMGAVVGAVLAAVGGALQALVRNPLAEGESWEFPAARRSARSSRWCCFREARLPMQSFPSSPSARRSPQPSPCIGSR